MTTHTNMLSSTAIARNERDVFVPDMCTVGIAIRNFPCVQAWLAANPNARLAIAPEVQLECARGEELIAQTKPDFAAALRLQRRDLFVERGIVVARNEQLINKASGLLDDPTIGADIRAHRGFEMRMQIVALALIHGLPILSGNRFYAKLATYVDMPYGVFDIYRDRWTVPCSAHV